MKLLQRTGRYYLIFSLIIFSVGGLFMFLVLRTVLDYETDEGLEHTRKVLKPHLAQLDTLPMQLQIMDEVVELHPVANPSELSGFSDTAFYDSTDQELEPYRTYTYTDDIDGKYYRIALHHSRVENQDLITTIFLVNLGILGLLLLSLNQLNRSLSKRLWEPFYETINQIRTFSIQQDEPLQLSYSHTEEFNQLNANLERMADKLQKDYRNLRRFTENASHEMQTPLAIMRNQVDLILQNPERSPADYENIRHLSEAISRLSKLNKALLLLTRIENEQYRASQTIDLLPLLETKLDALQTLLANRRISLQSHLQSCTCLVHPVLADVLLNNLLENAIKHNIRGGSVHLKLDWQQLLISNTGEPLEVAPEELFERFVKGKTVSQSLGLGLAIVREICHFYHWTLDYKIRESMHLISVNFQPKTGNI